MENTNNFVPATTNPFETQIVTGVADDGSKFVTDLTSETKAFCTAKPVDEIERALLFNAISSPEKKLNEEINMEIMVKDVYVEGVLIRQDDGSEQPCPRIVLIDINGVGHQSVSKGVYGSLKNLLATVGVPPYAQGIPIVVKQEKKGTNSILKFSLNITKMIEMKKVSAKK